ncbi:uncharacterized protein LOC121253247 isoform X2 [Juglans microcarpa x Juglans regia]|uniref:uncharacterized protein LOC121253247 isoform X2 n=1 Tax=Juglans microcarpa x Juglans regia TaxID=2249226 RepID=UPI001B7D9A97|nr:uncharacterized protein LOC121253247 isoform X2 [Juglans microcarpa x Juglans regia]
MKQRISEATPKDLSPIRTLPPLRSLHGVGRSHSQFCNPTSQGPKAKADDPKTSEFAFFRKVKENSGHIFHSDTLQEETKQAKKFKISDCSGESTNSVKNSCKNFRSSLLAENITPISFSSFLSPPADASKKSAHPWHGEIFSRKRQKLRQWVVETSYPNIEDLCSKGYDFVSVLLSRLFPENNEKSVFRNLKSAEINLDTKSQFLASLESDAELKKLNHIPARNYMELDNGSHLDDGPNSSCWLNRSQEAVLSNYHPSTSDSKIARLKYEIREPGYKFGERAPVLCSDSDLAYGFTSQRYESLAYSGHKKLGELHDPTKYVIEREPPTLLLGWDFDYDHDERNLSVICQSTEMNVHSPSSSSWGNGPQHILDDRFCLNELTKSSFLSIYSPNILLPWSQSASCSDHDFRRRVVECQENRYTDFNHFPLPLSITPDYLNLDEDCENDTKCKDGSILLAPQDLCHIMSKVLDEKNHHPGIEGFLLSSELDIDVEWNCRSSTGSSRKHHSPFNYALQSPQGEGTSSHFLLNDMNESHLDASSHRGTLSHFSEDIVNIGDWSSFYFHILRDKDKASQSRLMNQAGTQLMDKCILVIVESITFDACKHSGWTLHALIMMICF